MCQPDSSADAILASAVVSYPNQLKDGELKTVEIPDNIKTDDEFLAWIRSAN